MSDPYAKYTRLKFDRPHPAVLRITMENGRMNSADDAMHAELGEIWRDVDRDPTVNAAIITGAGRGLGRAMAERFANCGANFRCHLGIAQSLRAGNRQ